MHDSYFENGLIISMKIKALLRRLRTSAQAWRREPGLLLRAPHFFWRSLREGPQATLDRLRRISDPRRFSVDYEAWRAEFGTTAEEKQAMAAWAEALPQPVPIAVLEVRPAAGLLPAALSTTASC
jgi:hypothetical protein